MQAALQKPQCLPPDPGPVKCRPAHFHQLLMDPTHTPCNTPLFLSLLKPLKNNPDPYFTRTTLTLTLQANKSTHHNRRHLPGLTAPHSDPFFMTKTLFGCTSGVSLSTQGAQGLHNSTNTQPYLRSQ
jgi:hypothetical protein